MRKGDIAIRVHDAPLLYVRVVPIYASADCLPPRTTNILVENCPYLSGGRNTGVSGKRGHICFIEYMPTNSCRGRTKHVRKGGKFNLGFTPYTLEMKDKEKPFCESA